MAKRRHDKPDTPACYAVTLPGLESVTAEEITSDLGGDIRKVSRGMVVFRTPEISPDLLRLRTTEDVYILAWGSGSLTFKADDLKSIKRWTETECDWRDLVAFHNSIHPLKKGRPTYRVVAQMSGEHGYRRVDAKKAFTRALSARMPGGWTEVDEDATLEVWLTIRGRMAVAGVRLSDATMRHRTYKSEHLPASLRPSLAAVMARLAGASPGHVVLDPMCGAGTILAEQIDLSRARRAGHVSVWGGDIDSSALVAAAGNIRQVGPASLAKWDARRLPLADQSVDRVVCNPPFGKQLSSPAEIGPLYRAAVREMDRVLRPDGRAVLLVAEADELRKWASKANWIPKRSMDVQVLGQDAKLGVWQKR